MFYLSFCLNQSIRTVPMTFHVISMLFIYKRKKRHLNRVSMTTSLKIVGSYSFLQNTNLIQIELLHIKLSMLE